MRQILLLMAFSFLLSSCGGVDRPDADVCIANVLALHQSCYNLRRDYEDSGQLKQGAKPHFKPCKSDKPCLDPSTHYNTPEEMVADLHKAVVFDTSSWPKIKAWIEELRNANQ